MSNCPWTSGAAWHLNCLALGAQNGRIIHSESRRRAENREDRRGSRVHRARRHAAALRIKMLRVRRLLASRNQSEESVHAFPYQPGNWRSSRAPRARSFRKFSTPNTVPLPVHVGLPTLQPMRLLVTHWLQEMGETSWSSRPVPTSIIHHGKNAIAKVHLPKMQ